ncbi:MAG: hypothetical protein DRG31_05435 [Deltaproteobacteria bacterium]|nr:MAG: hypothetical protein DRG31_05435 [Deltaproteobacteria bacterium]
MEVRLEGIETFACRGINLEIREGEILVLLGPTGAGKTTLLNCIAGLIPYKGRVLLGNRPVDHLPPEKRGIGYVFQDLALFPHMTVWENVAFGLRTKGIKGRELRERVSEILELLRIRHLLDRYPRQLSGGEAQRVALARALAPMPCVLLLDEPFSKLDLRTAKILRLEFKRVQRQTRITTLFVTHNQAEAFEMGDRIAVMDHGRIQQVGPPEELLFSPRNEAVSRYFGYPNVLDCLSQKELDSGLALVDTGSIRLFVPSSGRRILKVAFSPSNVYLSREAPPGPKVNRFRGRIIGLLPDPPVVKVQVQVEGCIIGVEVEEGALREMGLEVGQDVHLIIPLRWIRTLEVDDGV